MASEAAVDVGATPLIPRRLSEFVADAYRDAALAGVVMDRAVVALEAVRAPDEDGEAAFVVWRRVDDQIGTFFDDPLRPVLAALRSRIVEETKRSTLGEVGDAFARSSDDGWTTWLRLYAEAFCAWRQEICMALASPELEYPAEAPPADYLRTMTRLVVHERWAEAHDFMVWLSEQDPIPATFRARLRVYAGQVQLYHIAEPREALKHFQAAESIAPEDDAVVAGLGEYALNNDELETCREFFQRSIAIAPELSDAYALMGDSYERSGELDVAEEWYRETIERKPGESQGYLRLIRLFGRPELLEAREAEILPLFERAVAVDPIGEYGACLEVGGAYRSGGKFERAQEWHGRAIDLDLTRLAGHIAKGNTFLDAGDSKQAQQAFQQAIDVAPESFDGYWGMALAFDQEEGCAEDALRWLEKALPRRPAWEGLVRGKMGALHLQCGRYGEAEKQLLDALRRQPDDQSTLTSLQNLAALCFKPDPALSKDDALRILQETRAIAGDPWEVTFQNLLGNLRYFFGEYASAIAAYERAIALVPDEAVYHSNLAGAVELAAAPGARAEALARALSELRRAHELDPEDPEYPERIAVLAAEESVISDFGEVALDLVQTPPLIGVDVSPELLPEVRDDESGELTSGLLEALEAMRERIRGECGVLIPGVLFGELESPGDGLGSYSIKIREATCPLEHVPTTHRFHSGPLEPLVQANVAADVRAQSLRGAWVSPDHWNLADAAGLPLQTPVQYMLGHLESVMRSNLHLFLDYEQVSALLAELPADDGFADSVELLPGLVSSLRALVREHVPITAFDAISRAYTELARDGLDQVALVERLRSLPEVVPHLQSQARGATLYRVGARLATELEQHIETTGAQPVLALPLETDERVKRHLRDRVGFAEHAGLLVDESRLRPFVRALIEPQYPNVPVFSSGELQGVDVELAGEIGEVAG